MAETPLRRSGWHYEADKSFRRFVLKRASEKIFAIFDVKLPTNAHASSGVCHQISVRV